jgi:hypothetical protein
MIMANDRQTRLDTERRLIRQAMERLLASSPQRSDGKLTISALATEAQLPSQRLYEHHTDLITEFHTKAGGGPIPPSVAALQQQLADARARIQQLEAREAQLLAQNQTLCAVITELTHETHADNVITLHIGRSRRT